MKELYDKIAAALPTIQGWCTPVKANAFADVIINTKPELCVEIGVFGGASLIPQALALKQNGSGIIYGIDPWSNECALEEMIHEDHKNWWGKLDINAIYQHCVANIDKYQIKNCCKLLRAKAEDVVNEFANESIDILHIDGNHSEVLSYKDATLYLPKVKVGGYIFFDDIYWAEVGNKVTTRKAISYLLKSCDKIDVVNNDCMIMKKVIA